MPMSRGAEDARPQDPAVRRQSAVPLATLIARELRGVNGVAGKSEKPTVKFGVEAFKKRGEDLFLTKPDCVRIDGNPSTSFSVFAIFDGHNGVSAAVFTREHLLEHVMSALPRGIGREEWLELLPSALVAGFVKTDIDFQRQGETSGTTATLVVIDGLTVTVASVGDSRCILESPGSTSLCLLTVDHRLEENLEERERVTASGGEVARLNVCGGREIGPLRCWPGGLCLSRSIGDMDVGEYIVPVPHVKQVKLSSAGGRLIIASDGIWDALSSDMVAKACHGIPAELAAKQVVKEALRTTGLKDDTTCLVVDIIPFNQPAAPLSPPKQPSKLMSLLFRIKSQNGRRNKLSSVGAVEELFEEGSAMLEERLGKAFLSKTNSDPLRCALCHDNQAPEEDLSIDIDACYSPTSNPWEGAYLCNECRRKKDAMEGKQHRESRMSR